MTYVDITRHFRLVDDNEPPSSLARHMARVAGVDQPLTWTGLLADGEPTIVLVAPSGTGKSTELQQQAFRLRRQGRLAVFVEAGAVVDAFVDGLSGDEHSAYERWKKLAEPLHLFVDAVDELHLRDRKLADLLRCLSRELDLATKSIRFVFSSRTGTWTHAATQQVGAFTRPQVAASPKVVAFEPVDDEDAVRALAAAEGVANLDTFMDAFRDEDLGRLSVLRPADICHLARLWTRGGGLGRWSDILDGFVDTSSHETDPVRAQTRCLVPQETRLGLQRIAAALLVMSRPQITLPTVAGVETAVSSRRLFDDWLSAKVVELFENPLLVHKGVSAEAAQLPAGPIYHFLAARWFAERIRHGQDAEALRDALLVRVFGESSHRIPSARREVVGWLASEAPTFRKLLLDEHPLVVLYQGDPDHLSDSEIKAALQLLPTHLAHDVRHEWPSPATARKLARPTLARFVSSLIDDWSAHGDDIGYRETLAHLLRLAEAGKFVPCVTTALDLAQDSTRDDRVRALAIRVVTSAGTPKQKGQLASLASTCTEELRDDVLLVLIEAGVTGDPLVDFICQGGDSYFPYHLAQLASRIHVSDLDAALARLTTTLSSETERDEVGTAFALAVPLMISRLRANSDLPKATVDALVSVERHTVNRTRYVSNTDILTISSFVREREGLRRALWEARIDAVERDTVNYGLLRNPAFGGATTADLDWLFTRLPTHYRWSVVDPTWASLSIDDREAVLASASAALREHVNALEAATVARDAESRKQEAQRRREEQRKRRANVRALAPRRAAIEAGAELNALVTAWARAGHPATTRRDLDLDRLRADVGDEYADVIQRGLIACWRRQDVPLPEPGRNQIPIRYLVGLTGLDLDIRAGVDLPSLQPAEADLAARYALYEMNAFPPWFAALLQAHPAVVREVLRQAVAADWNHPAPTHGILRFAPYSDVKVCEALRAIAIALLRDGPPANPQTTHEAVSAIVTGQSDAGALAALAEREIEGAAAPPEELLEWLRLWAHMAPHETAAWVESKVAGGDLPEPAVLQLADLLEQDLEEHSAPRASSALMAPRSLQAWLKIVLQVVRLEDDERNDGWHVVDTRERAEHFRDRCLSRLVVDPSPEAHAVLQELIADPALAAHRSMFIRMDRRQRQNATDAAVPVWTEEDVLRVERGDEKVPRTLEELFTMVTRHLRHVGRLVENDDFSYRDILRKAKRERDIQLWVASCLRERARGLYSVQRENVVDDDKEVDITVFVPGVGHVPIEIKPLGKYSPNQLEYTVRDQLLGRYMLPPDRRYGVLLLVRRDRRRWRLRGKQTDALPLLQEWVQERASAIASRLGRNVSVEVVDLHIKAVAPAPSARGPLGSTTARGSSSSKARRGSVRPRTGKRSAKRGSVMPRKRGDH